MSNSTFGTFFGQLSSSAQQRDFKAQFNTATGDPAIVSLGSLSSEFPGIVTMVRRSLGEPILLVELDNAQIAQAFENANLEFSRINNTYYVESFFANMLGIRKNYTLYDLQNKLPPMDYSILNKLTTYAGEHAQPYVGNRTPRMGYIDLAAQVEYYDLYSLGVDLTTSLPIESYVASVSGLSIEFTRVFHDAPPVYNRYYDPYSSIQQLNTEFGFESYPVETSFYMLPVWMDLARMSTLSMGDMLRKSHYRWSLIGRRIQILPRPKVPFRVYFEYVVLDSNPNLDPLMRSSLSSLAYATSSSAQNMATNLATVPLTDLTYVNCNSIGKQWIRRYTLAESMWILGWIRSKYSQVPISQTETATLNGEALMSAGNELKDKLETSLKEELQKMDLADIMQKEAQKAESMNTILKYSPMGIFKM